MSEITDKNGRELQKHGSMNFPCATYQTANCGFPWHWHEELEMICVEKGCLTVAAAEQRYYLSAGDGIVINADVPHALFPYGKAGYNESDIVFHPRLIYGSTDSVLWSGYLDSFLQCASLEAIPLRHEIAWQKEAAERILKACELCRQAPPMYEFAVREELTHIYLALWEHCKEQATLATGPVKRKTGQVKGMMRFLERHLWEEVSLQQLADDFHLSKRECQREFQSYLGTTPLQYLNQIRLARAADLLRETDTSITEICYQCGFQSPSYFSKKFRLRYGMTPRQYQTSRK